MSGSSSWGDVPEPDIEGREKGRRVMLITIVAVCLLIEKFHRSPGFLPLTYLGLLADGTLAIIVLVYLALLSPKEKAVYQKPGARCRWCDKPIHGNRHYRGVLSTWMHWKSGLHFCEDGIHEAIPK